MYRRCSPGPSTFVDAAAAQLRMLRVARRRPRACASSARTSSPPLGRATIHAKSSFPSSAGSRVGRTAVGRMHARRGSDEHEPQLIAERLQRLQQRAAAQYTSTSASSGAPIASALRSFSSSRDHGAAHAQHGVPIDRRPLRRALRQRQPGVEEHRFVARSRHEAPDLFRRERQDRREPAHHRLGDPEHRGLRRAPRMALRRRRVEPVLQHVEIEAAEVDAAEVVHLLVDQVELVVAISRDDLFLQLLACATTPSDRARPARPATPGRVPDRSRRDCRAGSARCYGCAGRTRRRASGSRPTGSSRSRSRSPRSTAAARRRRACRRLSAAR